MADVNQNQGLNDELDKKAIECSNNALFLASLPYETINDLYDELSNYNLKITSELKEMTKKYGVTSSIPLVGKAISFVKQKKLSKILKKAQKEGKRVKLEGSRKLERDFDKKMAQKNPNNTKDTAVTFEEIKEAGVKVIDSRDEYLAFKEEIIKKAGEISYDDLVKQAELWSTYYTNNLEYLQKREEIARGNYVQSVVECLGNVPKKKLPNGGVYCLIDNEPFTIRHNHKAEDLTAFYKKYKEIKLAKVPTEEILVPTQPKKDKTSEQSKTSDVEQPKIPESEPMPDVEITPNMQAYIDLMKLSGCSDEDAIRIATDPVNKDKFEKFDQTRGVTAYEEAVKSGKIPDNAMLGQFQFHVAQTEQRDIYNMDVQPIFDNCNKAMAPDGLADEEANKGDKASSVDSELEPINDTSNENNMTELDETFADFEPDGADYAVDNSSDPTRVMTPEEKMARDNLKNLPGKDLSGFDVSVYDQNPSAFEPNSEDFNTPIKKNSRFQALSEELNYLNNVNLAMNPKGDEMVPSNSPMANNGGKSR